LETGGVISLIIPAADTIYKGALLPALSFPQMDACNNAFEANPETRLNFMDINKPNGFFYTRSADIYLIKNITIPDLLRN
jgi:hypothetical protein